MGTASTKRILRLNAGAVVEEAALLDSAGAADAHRIPALGADGRIDDSMLPVGLELAPMSWAALQTAYPNGGGALAALPAGTRVYVTDSWARAYWQPNAAGTKWVPVAPVTLLSLSADSTGVLNSTSNFQAAITWTPPLDLFTVGSTVEIPLFIERSGGTAVGRITLRLGSSELADSPRLNNTNRFRFALRCDVRGDNVLRFGSGGNALSDQLSNGGSSLALVTETITGSNALEIGFRDWSATDSTTTYTIQQCAIILHPPKP